MKKPVILSSPPPQKLQMVSIPKLKVHQENENVTESVHDSNLNVDDIILEESSVESEMISFTNLNFSDLKSARARFLEYYKQKFLFYQWDVFADKIGDAATYLRYGPRDNSVLIFHWLIQFSPVNNISGFYFTNQEI